MNLDPIKNLGRWMLRRAQEKSTWAGLAMLAAALGHDALSTQLGNIGNAIVLILGGAGVALAAATTDPRLSPAPETDSPLSQATETKP